MPKKHNTVLQRSCNTSISLLWIS